MNARYTITALVVRTSTAPPNAVMSATPVAAIAATYARCASARRTSGPAPPWRSAASRSIASAVTVPALAIQRAPRPRRPSQANARATTRWAATGRTAATISAVNSSVKIVPPKITVATSRPS